MPDDSFPSFPCPPDEPVPERQCWCCAFYGLVRPVFRDGRCMMCLLLPSLCETGHGMAARYEGADDGA